MTKKAKLQTALFIENGDGEILLQLRDDKPGIDFPNCWGIFGGQIEEGETPEEAIVREIKEELNYDLAGFERFGTYEFQGYIVYMFRKVIPGVKIEDFEVLEGQRGAFFSPEEIVNIDCAAACRTIAEDYFRKFHRLGHRDAAS